MSENAEVKIDVTIAGTLEYRDEFGGIVGVAHFESRPLNLNQEPVVPAVED